MRVRLLYVSRAVGPQTTTVTASILAAAQKRNAADGIGGVLCQGQGMYLQVLEGERPAINRLYARIVTDPRHEDVQMLLFDEIAQPRFAGWSMALVNLSDRDPMVRLGHPEFDPYQASGADAMKLVDELLDSGRPIVLPADYAT